MSEVETFAERAVQEIIAADEATELYIRLKNIEGEHDGEKALGAIVLDIVAEDVGDEVIEREDLRYKTLDMGENYPGISILGYRKRVTAGKFGHKYKRAKPAFRVYELSRIGRTEEADSKLGVVIVDEVDECEPRVGLWVHTGGEEGDFHEVTEEDLEAGNYTSEINEMRNAISAPELV